MPTIFLLWSQQAYNFMVLHCIIRATAWSCCHFLNYLRKPLLYVQLLLYDFDVYHSFSLCLTWIVACTLLTVVRFFCATAMILLENVSMHLPLFQVALASEILVLFLQNFFQVMLTLVLLPPVTLARLYLIQCTVNTD